MNDMNAHSTEASYSFVEDFEKPLPPFPEMSRRRYLDPDFYQLEMDNVFRKSWLLVAHDSEFEKNGSYRVLEIEIAPVMIIRGKDGTLRAFLNSCRHRGSQIANNSDGCVHVLTCPLHGWTYNLEGKLIGVKNPEKFSELDPADYNLVELRCELWGGLVFINFDQAASPLLEWLTPSVVDRFTRMVESPTLRLVCKRLPTSSTDRLI